MPNDSAPDVEQMTPMSCALTVIKEFFDSISLADFWEYDTGGLMRLELGLRTSAETNAREHDFEESDIELTSRTTTAMFWRYMGLREGWEMCEKQLEDPRRVFPFALVPGGCE